MIKRILYILIISLYTVSLSFGMSETNLRENNISVSTGAGSISPTAKTFLPLGDSHTVGLGSVSGYGYRQELQSDFGNGFYNLVGPYQSPSSGTYGVNHAGVAGQTSAQILSRLPGLLTTYMSGSLQSHSLVMADAGTNDCAQSVSVSTIVANYVSMINDVHTFNSAIDIYVNVPNPTKLSTINTCLASLETTLIAQVLSMQGTITNLHVTDEYARFLANPTWQTDWMSNVQNSHPNDAGYAVWGDLMQTCINSPTSQYCDGN